MALAVGGRAGCTGARSTALVLAPDERELVRGLLRRARLSSLSSGASRSRAETASSMPSGHSMPTSGSSKRKPDSTAGS